MQKETKKHTIGFSPCPNDTFIFEALVHGRIDSGEFSLAKEILADVETLNAWAVEEKRLDISKISFHAFGHLTNDYKLLSAGCALGRGCGPLLVAACPKSRKELSDGIIGIPGSYTTAAMLLRMFIPECRNLVAMSFESIMPGIAAGRLDAGLIIHESRFTYPQYGLSLIEDLGAWWEATTGLPVPLGGIVAKKSLGEDAHRQLAEGIRQSLRYAWASPEVVMPYVKENAQELDERVIQAHIDLYVNSFTMELGEEGERAVEEFLARGRICGILPPLRWLNSVHPETAIFL